MFRVGLGQDSHRFEEEKSKKPLIFGGVLIPGEVGLKANSDGDVILHALCNALSSAAGGDSLGTWADKMCLKKGITDSREYLKVALKMVKQAGFKVNNISLAVEAKKPRLSLKTVAKIKTNIAKLTNISPEGVGITFTSGEGLTAFGKGEAIQTFAIVLLTKK